MELHPESLPFFLICFVFTLSYILSFILTNRIINIMSHSNSICFSQLINSILFSHVQRDSIQYIKNNKHLYYFYISKFLKFYQCLDHILPDFQENYIVLFNYVLVNSNPFSVSVVFQLPCANLNSNGFLLFYSLREGFGEPGFPDVFCIFYFVVSWLIIDSMLLIVLYLLRDSIYPKHNR